ncbi:tetratricopeptide repeat protein [Armatimonas sp.]|uniref:tetratricopeptide repeat protein n=1 Tax=Armatimonas sp. TaxID=1872638 RepID=UPI0037536D36
MKLIFKLLIGAGALPLLYVCGSFAYLTAKTGKTPFQTAHAAEFAAAGTLSESDVATRLAKDSGDPVAHCALAEKAHKRKDFAKAIAERKLALLREPENPQILFDTALDLMLAKSNDEAKIYCQKIIETRDPNLTSIAQKMLAKLEKVSPK